MHFQHAQQHVPFSWLPLETQPLHAMTLHGPDNPYGFTLPRLCWDHISVWYESFLKLTDVSKPAFTLESINPTGQLYLHQSLKKTVPATPTSPSELSTPGVRRGVFQSLISQTNWRFLMNALLNLFFHSFCSIEEGNQLWFLQTEICVCVCVGVSSKGECNLFYSDTTLLQEKMNHMKNVWTLGLLELPATMFHDS